MLVIGGRAADLPEGRLMAERAIADGSAFDKFRVLVEAQDGDVSYVDDTGNFPALDSSRQSPRRGRLARARSTRAP